MVQTFPLRSLTSLVCLALLTACAPLENTDSLEVADLQIGPNEPPPERCWSAAGASAETTDDKPTAPEGEEAAQSQPIAVAPDEEAAQNRFEVPCPDVMTPEFIAALQRALAARGYLTAPVTSRMDAPTRAAVATYQAEQGLMSDQLSLATARAFGLVAVERGESG